ncbi:MAG TPA: LptF/LptG family permease [Cytophagales bacterium]|nr:LptF/LptG family permease [Cytophagales bacterium]
MKILDWYILKSFLTAFFFVVLIIVSIICIINLTEMNDKFIKHGLGAATIAKYYLYYTPYIANLVSPIMVFIATVFVTSKMASHTEIIAILSSGVSFRRMMVPYIIGASMLAVLTFLMVGWIIPNSNKFRINFELQYLKNPYTFEGRNVHFKVAPDTYIYIQDYYSGENKGYRFTIEKIENNKLKEKLKADYITWVPEKNKWRVSDYQIHKFLGMEEEIIKGKAFDTTLNLYPKDFESTYSLQESLTLNELSTYIAEQRERGKGNLEIYIIQRYTIFIYPVAIIILTLIGLIVSARKSRGGAGFQIALGFLIAFVYILFVVMSRSIALSGTTDFQIAMLVLLPNALFAAVGVILYHTVPR